MGKDLLFYYYTSSFCLFCLSKGDYLALAVLKLTLYLASTGLRDLHVLGLKV